MNADKILEVIAIYRGFFTKEGIDPVDFPHIDSPYYSKEMLSHCCGMIDKMEKFVREGRIEKAYRWLGFVQGCLWTTGVCSLEDLKNHSRPDIEKVLG